MALRPHRLQDARTAACPCGRGNVPAELAAQHPLLERAAAGDRGAFALLYDTQVEGVYRYLLAWTGNQLDAAELTSQVFHSAIGWLPATTGAEGEAGAWLIAMARDAIAHRRPPVADGSPAAGGDVVAAVSRLGDPEREVVVLRLLLGHSLDHTAHLSGYSRRAAMELQLAACLTVHQLITGIRQATPEPGTQAAPPAETRAASSAEELELRLGHWETGQAGSAPARAGPLADAVAVALAVAGSLRRAAPGIVSAPADGLVQRLRADLVAGSPSVPGGAAATLRSAGPAAAGPRPAGTGIQGWFARRPWVATGVATAGIVVVLGFQAFGGSGGPPECGGRPCPTPATVVAAAAGGGSTLGTPPTTVVESSTTSSTVAGEAAVVAPTAAPPTSAARVPPSTRPATTRPPTTAPRPTTTTAPPTTAPPTTAASTTTTVAPAPT